MEYLLKKRRSTTRDSATGKLIEIESTARFTSRSIGALSDHPALLKAYLESSIANTFSELMFRLTHEIYDEGKARSLWNMIATHRAGLKTTLGRDVGLLVASLDYLSNISGDLVSPKIMDDSHIEEAARRATRDSLTGLYLRGVFEFSLERLVDEHRRTEQPLSVALIDIDDFKQVNDQCGHQRGDEVLQIIGNLLLKNTRASDFSARYGGEELAIIFPDTSLDDAIGMADRIRAEIQQCFSVCKPFVTVSIGLSGTGTSAAITARQLTRNADIALYKAKAAGKNQVIGLA